jgi:hypothetical protein
MNQYLKYFIYFLLGVIIYYFLFNSTNANAQKLIEGFGLKVNSDNTYLYYNAGLNVDEKYYHSKNELSTKLQSGLPLKPSYWEIDSSNTLSTIIDQNLPRITFDESTWGQPLGNNFFWKSVAPESFNDQTTPADGIITDEIKNLIFSWATLKELQSPGSFEESDTDALKKRFTKMVLDTLMEYMMENDKIIIYDYFPQKSKFHINLGNLDDDTFHKNEELTLQNFTAPGSIKVWDADGVLGPSVTKTEYSVIMSQLNTDFTDLFLQDEISNINDSISSAIQITGAPSDFKIRDHAIFYKNANNTI